MTDGLPDMPISQRDVENPAGNHIVLRPVMELGFSWPTSGGSVVRPATRGTEKSSLKSGTAKYSEPHLHIQAMKISEEMNGWVFPLRSKDEFSTGDNCCDPSAERWGRILL